MALPATIEPMEARLASALPLGEGWRYEPKWDGFRCIATRAGARIDLRAKSGKPLGRYFPEVEAMLAALCTEDFVVDGELVIAIDGRLRFGALQARLHPAESRIRRLAAETPARLVLFDCLRADGVDLGERPLVERRAMLERLIAREKNAPRLLLSPTTADPALAARWLAGSGGALDGVVAKRSDEPYAFGARAMIKVKPLRSADCVVGGFRTTDGGAVASLLLGLYDADGKLDHVGFISGFPATERAALAARLAPLVGPPGFTGKTPGGPSRWSADKDTSWTPLRPELVVEACYDQVTDARFRHAARFIRWRPDKAPRQCTMDQLAAPLPPAELGSFA